MPIAGWCRVCGSYQYLNEAWGCAQGHAWTEISNWYDADTGQPFTPEWASAAPAPAAAPEPAASAAGTRDALLTDLMASFAGHGGYTAAFGDGADLTIGNQVADASWGTGKKKVTYEAVMKAVEPERTLYFWEVLKESGGCLSFGSMDFESSSTMGTKRWGTTKEVVIGPQGKALDYSWDYAATRNLVTEVATRHGWQVKTVIAKKKAMW